MKSSLSLVCFLLLVNCAERNFSGGNSVAYTSTGHSDAKPIVEAKGTPVGDTVVPPLPSSQGIEDTSASVPAPSPQTIEEATVTPPPAPVPSTPATTVGTESKTPVIPPPMTIGDTTVVFGSDEVFRIGDGNSSASSCQQGINSFNLAGTAFFFEFEVLNDDTSIDLSINRICGVDYPDSNFVNLLDANNKELQSDQLLPVRIVEGGAGYKPFSTFKLNKGIYSVVVFSAFNNYLGDNDDFIIGKISLKGSKNIKSRRVYAK